MTEPSECSVCGLVHFYSECPDGPHTWKDAIDLPEGAHLAESSSNAYQDQHGPTFEEMREPTLHRYGWKCSECGISNRAHKNRDDLWPPNGGLHIHHIIPVRRFDEPENAHNLMNLEPLCDSCHKEKTANERQLQ